MAKKREELLSALDSCHKDIKAAEDRIKEIKRELGVLKFGVNVGDGIVHNGQGGIVCDLDEYSIKYHPYKKSGELSSITRCLYSCDEWESR